MRPASCTAFRNLRAMRSISSHVLFRRGLADGVGHVERVEVARLDEAVNGVESYVVCVHAEGLVPAEFFNRRLRGRQDARRLGADNRMLPERLVPDGRHLDAAPGRLHARAQLRLRLMGEAVADPERVFLQPQSVAHALLLNFRVCVYFMTAASAGSTLRSSSATTRPKTLLPRSPRCV